MEWKEVTLGEITNLVIDYRGKTPLKLGYSWSDSGYRALSAKNIKTGQIVAEDSIRFVDEQLYRKWMKDEVKRGDILITSEAPFGQIFYWDSDEKIVLSQRLFDVRLNDEVCHKYVYYFMTSHHYQKDLEGRATGTTVTGLRQPELLKSTILLPPLSAQRSIASILSSLDRKIELNNKINADLEEMAQAIFKNWFVDFEPFKDGEFVDSELGMIPEGWKVVTLDELTSKFGTGLNPRKNFVLGHGNNYYVTIKNMGNNRIYLNDRCDKVDDEALAKINKRSKLQKGDLLFSGIGTIGRVAMVVDDPVNWNTSESVFNMHPIDTISSEFIYLLLLSDIFQQYVQQNAQGGVQQGIRMASLKAFRLAIPDDLKAFDNLVKPIIAKVKNNDKENDSLSLLRDTLLPRLMSGEIEVPK